MRMLGNYLFFYNGCFSNWHRAKFTDPDGHDYNCAEQYLMAGKAKLFGDMEIHKKILASCSPATQKKLGKQVTGFTEDIWDMHKDQIMYDALYYKFTQNDDLYKELMDSDPFILVEASPTDTVWGIGMGEYDKGIENEANWKGTNLLGRTLVKLREHLHGEAK